MNYLIGLIGPSASGKSRIMIGALKRIPDKVQIIKSDTTRQKRRYDEAEDYFYNFVSKEEFKKRAAKKMYANVAEYNNNYYGSNLPLVSEILKDRHGMLAIVETSVKTISKDFNLKLIKIEPLNQTMNRGETRISEDDRRSTIALDYDAVIQNSFEPGGLEKAIDELVNFIQNLK